MSYVREQDIIATPPEEIVLDLSGDAGPYDSPIRELKSAVLAIDWEITDSILLRFDEEITELLDVLTGDPHALRVLKLLGAVGRYIRNKKANAHPLSIQVLHSSFAILEELVNGEHSLPHDYKTELVGRAFATFEELKASLKKSTPDQGEPNRKEPGVNRKESSPHRKQNRTTPPAREAPPLEKGVIREILHSVQGEHGEEDASQRALQAQIAHGKYLRSLIREELARFKKELLAELAEARMQE